MVTNISMIVPWNAHANDSESHLMVTLTNKLELQGFLWRNFNSQRTCVANSTVLTPVQPKIQASNVLEFVPFCANKHVKEKEEKEKNTTVFTKFHRELLAIISAYLLPY